MIIYWIALIITCILSYFLIYTKNDSEKNITHFKVFISFSPLFLVELFRWNVGVDVVYGSGYYYQAYEAIKLGGGNIFDYETGFFSLMQICNSLNLNLYLFYCIVTFLFFYLFTKFIAVNSKKIILSAIIFVLSDLYLFTFSTLRQCLGIAFALYPLTVILKDNKFYKNWKLWIATIISFTMHGTVIYLFLIVLLSKIRINKKKLIALTSFLCVLSPFLYKIIGNMISNLTYFDKYFGSELDVSSFSITYFAIALILFIFSIINYKKIIELNNKNYILINVCAFTTILMANSKLLIMPYRIFPLFVPLYIIVCSNILTILKRKTYKYLCTSLCLIIPFLLLFINQYYIGNGSKYFKYRSIFDYPSQVWSKE